MHNSTNQRVLFQWPGVKPVSVEFSRDRQSSDGGLPLIQAADLRLGLTERLAKCFRDRRLPQRVLHSLLDMVRLRVYGIAAGYSDCNDVERIGADPLFKAACGRDPESGHDLPSQPTLSRFENAATPREVVDALRVFERVAVERFMARGTPKLVTIDFDPTVDETHGQQVFSFFHGHYDTHCYLPLLGFLTADDEPAHFLFFARLRPGSARDPRGMLPALKRVIGQLRAAAPSIRIRVRLDGGFMTPYVLDRLDELAERYGLEYVMGMPSNSRLEELTSAHQYAARFVFEVSGESVQLFGDFEYAAKSWSRKRRIVVKAETVAHVGREGRDNTRFLVTNMTEPPEATYQMYRDRGAVEQCNDELKNDLDLDRTSATTFCANQLRVLFSAAAYVLYQELRWNLAGTRFARSRAGRLREFLVKLGATIGGRVRQLRVLLPSSYPWKLEWLRLARRLCAAGP